MDALMQQKIQKKCSKQMYNMNFDTLIIQIT